MRGRFDIAQLIGHAFGEQRFARLAREMYMQRGRGALAISVGADGALKPAYNSVEDHDGSDEAKHLQMLIKEYDPATQAVIVIRDYARRKDTVTIVDIVSVN